MGGWWQTKFNVSPGPGLLSRSRSRSGPERDLTWTGPGPDLGPGMGPGMGPGPELDNIFSPVEDGAEAAHGQVHI